MSEKEGRGIAPVTSLYPYDSYECSTFLLTSNRSLHECFGHYIRTRDLRALLLDTIKTVSAYAISNEAEFIEKVWAASEVRQAQAAKDLKRKLSKDRKRPKELEAFEADTAKVDQFLALTKKFTDFSVLTTPMIYEFVDKILVHTPDRSSGERTQEVDIYLKFIGKFDVPLPGPTLEELAEMEKVRQRRAKGREKWRRSQEKKKQQKQKTA